jgi:hypothetical protein
VGRGVRCVTSPSFRSYSINAVAYAGYESFRDLRLTLLSLHFTETASLLFFLFSSHLILSHLISSYLISSPLLAMCRLPCFVFFFSFLLLVLLSSPLLSSPLLSSPLLSSPPHSSETLCTAPSQCQIQS